MVITFPEELIPILNPPVAVTMPVIFKSDENSAPQERFPDASVISSFPGRGVSGKV